MSARKREDKELRSALWHHEHREHAKALEDLAVTFSVRAHVDPDRYADIATFLVAAEEVANFAIVDKELARIRTALRTYLNKRADEPLTPGGVRRRGLHIPDGRSWKIALDGAVRQALEEHAAWRRDPGTFNTTHVAAYMLEQQRIQALFGKVRREGLEADSIDRRAARIILEGFNAISGLKLPDQKTTEFERVDLLTEAVTVGVVLPLEKGVAHLKRATLRVLGFTGVQVNALFAAERQDDTRRRRTKPVA